MDKLYMGPDMFAVGGLSISMLVNKIHHRYWRRHRGFKGFAARGHSKRKK